MILLLDVLNIMNQKDLKGNPEIFSICFFTYSRTKKTGGEMIELKNAVKTGLPFSLKDSQMIGVKVPKSSHHPIAVNTRLITRFNGEKVVL